MERYLGHTCGDRVQTVKEHLEGTAVLSGEFASRFGKRDWGYCCGLLHDIGKYSAAFQKKITENSDRRVDHSSAGMQVCFEKGGMYGFMGYCIAGHHAGLPNYGAPTDDAGSSSLCGRRKRKLEDYQAYRNEIKIPELASVPFDVKKAHDPDFSMSVFIRMLYSCLVDADFLDTETFMKEGETGRIPGDSLEVLLERLETYISDWLESNEEETVNGRRTEILRHCLESGSIDRGLFRLTVPTGGGKTISSLAFALRHAVKHGMDRVIYVIPYTSIIEQNAAVFREILGDSNVLEHHSNMDDFTAEGLEETEELKAMHLAAENWDKPVIVTTNVQFFESLYGSRSSRCRKLHNIANSVIIFDEAQMLPTDYLKPCTAMIEELIANYRVSAVLCTATQPALRPFFPKERHITELCPRMEEQFRFFKRTTFCDLGTVSKSQLEEHLSAERKALCIVNTRRQAQELYKELKGEGVYHLSTSMYPSHRRRVLEEIKTRLDDGRKCLVVSTSLVEAGVDLDFDTVYRELAGVDSMIQAAGRCNREGKRGAGESNVFTFSLEGEKTPPGQAQQTGIAKSLLEEGMEFSSTGSVEEYFRRLYHVRDESLDKKKILEAFKNKSYPFATVGKEFRLIEEESISVVVAREEEAEELVRQIHVRGCTREDLRRLQQYCVPVHKDVLDKLSGAGMIRPVLEELGNLYELTAKERYTDEMGLDLEIETGIASFF